MELDVKSKISDKSVLKVAPFKKHIRKTKPHKHSKYIEIVYFSQGTGKHTIDTFVCDLTPPICNVILKDQVHFWDIESEPEGYVILIKKEFVDNCSDIKIRQLIASISKFKVLKPLEVGSIETLLALMSEEYSSIESDLEVQEGLLKALLLKLLKEQTMLDPSMQIQSIDLYTDFLSLLETGEKIVNNVSYYADLLSTTPQNLNTICRKQVDESASEVLSSYIINEAKRLIIYTQKSIKEIGYELHFKDNSHFTKYFKRYTGVTPVVFRKKMLTTT